MELYSHDVWIPHATHDHKPSTNYKKNDPGTNTQYIICKWVIYYTADIDLKYIIPTIIYIYIYCTHVILF